jgi:hypothetical protein
MNWEHKTIRISMSHISKGWLDVKIDEEKLDKKINELAGDGWEVAAAFSTTSGGSVSTSTDYIYFTFKRQR